MVRTLSRILSFQGVILVPAWQYSGDRPSFYCLLSGLNLPSLFSYRLEDDCGKDYREREREYDRDREYERMQRERDKLRRQEEERRRQKERFEKEKVFRRKEEDVKRERDSLREKGKRAELAEYMGNAEKSEKVTKEEKKEDMAKRDRIRNKVLIGSVIKSLFFVRLWVYVALYYRHRMLKKYDCI